ncbi:hypothetical protein MUO56_01415 [Candidatus Bathyarchaeota archaeon]|jgi:hypothetical protein|nr:hypothetical protein [Candidatus Bathyarchaeota archaeon]
MIEDQDKPEESALPRTLPTHERTAIATRARITKRFNMIFIPRKSDVNCDHPSKYKTLEKDT